MMPVSGSRAQNPGYASTFAIVGSARSDSPSLAFVDVTQLPCIERVGAGFEAERIELGIAQRVRMHDGRKAAGQQVIGLERHGEWRGS